MDTKLCVQISYMESSQGPSCRRQKADTIAVEQSGGPSLRVFITGCLADEASGSACSAGLNRGDQMLNIVESAFFSMKNNNNVKNLHPISLLMFHILSFQIEPVKA